MKPFGWWDSFNGRMWFTEADADAARRGGNFVTPLYASPGNFADVRAFHERFGLDATRPAVPGLLSLELFRYRFGFLLEELGEAARAHGAVKLADNLHALSSSTLTRGDFDPTGGATNLMEFFDGLLDLSVVTLGTADLAGLPWEDGWRIVMERNNAKRRAAADGSDSKRSSRFDIVKPPGWYGPGPELTALLRSRGAVL